MPLFYMASLTNSPPWLFATLVHPCTSPQGSSTLSPESLYLLHPCSRSGRTLCDQNWSSQFCRPFCREQNGIAAGYPLGGRPRMVCINRGSNAYEQMLRTIKNPAQNWAGLFIVWRPQGDSTGGLWSGLTFNWNWLFNATAPHLDALTSASHWF